MALRMLTTRVSQPVQPRPQFKMANMGKRNITTKELFDKVKALPVTKLEPNAPLNFLPKGDVVYDAEDPILQEYLSYYENPTEEKEADLPPLYVPAEDVAEWIETARDFSINPQPFTITQSPGDIVFGPAGKYARNLLSNAVSDNNVDKVEQEAKKVIELIQDPELGDELRNPTNPKELKLEIIEAVLGEVKASNTLKEFLENMVDNKRGGLIASTLGNFSKLAALHRHEIDGTITTAEPLSNDMLQKVENILKKRFLSAKDKLKLKNVVDPAIVGGCKLRVGNSFADFSYKTMWEEKVEAMAEETRVHFGEMIAEVDARK